MLLRFGLRRCWWLILAQLSSCLTDLVDARFRMMRGYLGDRPEETARIHGMFEAITEGCLGHAPGRMGFHWNAAFALWSRAELPCLCDALRAVPHFKNAVLDDWHAGCPGRCPGWPLRRSFASFVLRSRRGTRRCARCHGWWCLEWFPAWGPWRSGHLQVLW